MSHKKKGLTFLKNIFKERKNSSVSSPYSTLALRARINFQYLVIGLITAYIFVQQHIFFTDKKLMMDHIKSLNVKIDKKEWLVVQPNIPVQTVKPNIINPDVVGSFFNFVASMLTKFTWKDVEVSYTYLGTFLNRDFRVTFRNQWQAQLDKWLADNYEQISHLPPVKEYYVEGNNLVAFFKYEVDRWVARTPLSSEKQYLIIYLTTKNVTNPKLGAPIEVLNFEFLDEKEFLNKKEQIEKKYYRTKIVEEKKEENH